MSHEPLAFLSGSFKGSQLRWVTVDKEGLAIVNTFQHSYAQGECRMNALMHVAEDVQGDAIVLVDCEGFDAEERTWESLRKIHFSAPDFVLKELRKLRLTRALKGKLASEYSYGISL